MNEREMLEWAAKACGIKNPRYCPEDDGFLSSIEFDDENDCTVVWQPHLDDGDALRLAVKLGIDVSYVTNPSGENIVMASQECEFSGWFEELLSIDPCEATRRAITRAASQIGKSMP